MAQSQCRRSVGDYFWPGVVVENKESLNNPNKSGAVTLSEASQSASDGCKIVRSASRFCSNFSGFTHRRRIATDLWLTHKHYFSQFASACTFPFSFNIDVHFVKSSRKSIPLWTEVWKYIIRRQTKPTNFVKFYFKGQN